ncbi:NAD(P)/FAD-dependent oxidoreductase [Brevirhabdus sp.]|uniref:NAD(P)/FAD-dependent oxidoreductase n=1 Tax=Brevirhabdus sp. TaxID=2004514 RepID=UPI004058377C
MNAQRPVTIIGAGIVGICCALSLRARGIPVRLIDRGAPGQETSFGNAGVISPLSIVPQAQPGIWRSIPGMLLAPDGPLRVNPRFWPRMVPWGLRFLRRAPEASVRQAADAMEVLCGPSIELYRRHLEGTGHEGLIVDSHYIHAFRRVEKARLEALDYRIRTERGGQLELVDGAALRALEPALSEDFRAAIVIKGQARSLSPGRMGAVLAEKLRREGAEFLRAEVRALKRGAGTGEGADGAGWQLVTDGETLHADRVILAAGVWSAALLRPLGLRLPLVAERGYHLEFRDPGVALNHSVMDAEGKVVASSMLDGLRVAGTSEFAAPDAPPDPRREAALLRRARAMLPDLSPADSSFWMGRRPSLPDSLPVLGPLGGRRGLYGAFGHSHHGLMMAPKTGEVLADLLAGTPGNADLRATSAARF